MTVRDFMTEKLITVTPQTPIFDAIDLMKKHDIHRLPVMEDHKLVGLITQGVIQESMPSKATSLSVFELNYLINKTKVGDVMLTDVTTIEADALLEDAIKVMRTKSIGVLPVMEKNQLVGIITNNDIFDAFLKISGYENGGVRVTLKITKEHHGILAVIAKELADAQMNIETIVVNRLSKGIFVEIQLATKDVKKVKAVLTSDDYELVDVVLTNTIM
ncbi:CBS domain-containing protein [Enterococcus cecorum]|uniref:CBS domain-containing protein n=1 Tax=Enterococcus cecorum TaxID=44008 RepID=UPI0022DB8AE9|nr:CBS domain-containing protein [Enterococcus cecorum]CAI3258564.1 CBS domain-containing protein [Enterococcus cecorum]CAI3292365.1 CBS domain-containing protein [Enterococcus cecorum]CAI3312722.1 CBS domain-containing protein [Enterococcus cecorum]CAI3324220.1 CBS domain-containing protein [Enterococcus cecorum]CAI3328123.1 CBS domain-containing protein [Enterococcus cecorum]